MEKYKVNESVKNAIISAAVQAGSFKKLGEEAGVEGIKLQLIADGHYEEISAKTLSALMPKIIGYLPGNEKKRIVKFVSLGHSKEEGQHNG